MRESESQNLLIIGVDTSSIANSAKGAGYNVYAADYFGDVDLRRVCSKFRAIIRQKEGRSCGRMESRFKPEAFLKMARDLTKKHKIDAVLLASGLDDHFRVLYELSSLAPIVGNPPRVIRRVREKPGFFKELDSLGVGHPETAIAKNIDEAKAAAARIEYPVVVKPIRGFGGAHIRTAQNLEELGEACHEVSFFDEEILVQESIDGLHASVSILATTKDVEVLTINEQLLGLSFLFQEAPFGYCGNIVPLRVTDSTLEKCKRIAEKIALRFGLQGSNGIDVVVSKDGTPYVIEVNPRFQGTLECVERVLGVNLVESHINSCLHGSLPTVKGKTSAFCTRLILYSPRRIIAPDLMAFREVRDIPLPKSIIEKGEPLCSVIGEGKSRNLSFQRARKLAESVYGMLRSA